MTTIISFHGLDGAGKSTLMDELERSGMLPDAAYIRKEYRLNAQLVQEYCGRASGDGKDWVAGSFAEAMSIATAFDFLAHYHANIAPLIGRRSYVVCDRYALCYAAYILATGSNFSHHDLFRGVRKPDVAVLVDVDMDRLPERYAARGGASEDETLEVMQRFREGYERLLPLETARVIRVSNNGRLACAFRSLTASLEEVLSAGRTEGVSA